MILDKYQRILLGDSFCVASKPISGLGECPSILGIEHTEDGLGLYEKRFDQDFPWNLREELIFVSKRM
ncbi:MAG: hypothetical protein M1289_02865 [Patescibacteria group bacterium]|nr:hypothetical protein [Patescibacteria group bacterium]